MQSQRLRSQCSLPRCSPPRSWRLWPKKLAGVHCMGHPTRSLLACHPSHNTHLSAGSKSAHSSTSRNNWRTMRKSMRKDVSYFPPLTLSEPCRPHTVHQSFLYCLFCILSSDIYYIKLENGWQVSRALWSLWTEDSQCHLFKDNMGLQNDFGLFTEAGDIINLWKYWW